MADININGVIIPNDDAWIYDWFDIGYTTPAQVEAALSAVPNGEQVNLYINSGGGSLWDGVEIYTKLKAYTRGEIRSHVILAASAASVVACAGYCDISPGGQIMIHNVAATGEGNKSEHKKLADILQTADEAVANAYVLKTGLDREQLLGLMDEETWLNAQRAVELGFADAIMFDEGNALGAKLTAAIKTDGGLLPTEVITKCRAERSTLTASAATPAAKNGTETPTDDKKPAENGTNGIKNVSKAPETAACDKARAEARLRLIGLKRGGLSL